MNRTSVSSTNLLSVGFDPTAATLEVEFRHGGIYLYFNVPASRHAGLLSAHSHGGYFDTFIKDGGYSYRHVR